MKNNLLAGIVLALSFGMQAQDCSPEKSAAYQQQLNSEYANPEESPLTEKDLKKFKGLAFYPVDMEFCITAKFIRTPNEKPFEVPTTTSRKPLYVKYGEVHFMLQGKECRLDVFQNIELVKQEEYKDYLFLPFTDLTSGNGSYGGGRYIDVRKPEGDTMVIDFNTSYNPYCAYNHNYSCPLTPPQNDLPVEVRAGVKNYKKKH